MGAPRPAHTHQRLQLGMTKPRGQRLAVVLLILLVLLLPVATHTRELRVWHLTDVHVDPYYAERANADGCWCETYSSCQRMGKSCTLTAPGDRHAAGVFGSSEGNCATPKPLYASAVEFMNATAPDASLVYFTGDFAEAGAVVACDPSSSPQAQLLDIITYDWTLVRKFLGGPAIFGSLGNHDSTPGDTYYETARQSWLYDFLSALWLPDVGADGSATVATGGYYAAPVPETDGRLVVVSLNVNYFVLQNPALQPGTPVWDMATAQLAWLNATLAAARAKGQNVHVLGHQPPMTGPLSGASGGAEWLWHPELYRAFGEVCFPFRETIRGYFFGHVHTDQWTMLRTCTAGNASVYKETTGIKWCSGGGDYTPGNVFGGGVDGKCPQPPPHWDTDTVVQRCEQVCTNATSCVGFTLYFHDDLTPKECCFRTGTTSSKPADPTSTARCYEKQGGTCNGPAFGVALPGPSLTEGYPATNPAVRLITLDVTHGSFALTRVQTYSANLHQANGLPGSGGSGSGNSSSLAWALEYDFADFFAMPDLSVASFQDAVERMAANTSSGVALWNRYLGQGDGSVFCTGYNASTAPFSPTNPCVPCQGACKDAWIAVLNGSIV